MVFKKAQKLFFLNSILSFLSLVNSDLKKLTKYLNFNQQFNLYLSKLFPELDFFSHFFLLTMETKLMDLDQCRTCKENVEFKLRLTISNLQLCGLEFKLGFENLKFIITLDGFVQKFEEIEEDDPIICDLQFQATPENFKEKLHNSPIMINLSRNERDLGTARINIADCFASSVMCDEFENQTFETEYVLTKYKTRTCGFDLILQIFRKPADCQEFADYLKKRDRMKNKSKKVESSDESSDGLSKLKCDDYLTTDCPFDSDSYDAMTSNSFRPSTSKSNKSSKCKSDIATSLDHDDFRDDQKTPCLACGGMSVSGVTCDNIEAFTKICETNLLPKKCEKNSLTKICEQIKRPKAPKCEIPVNRVCSECFEDLSVVPHNAPCPRCDAYKRQLQRAVSFKSEKQQKCEQEKIRNCLRSIFEEILLGDKARVEKDMKRLKGERKKRKNGKRMRMEEICGKRKRERNSR